MPVTRALKPDPEIRAFKAALTNWLPRRAIVLIASKGDPRLVRSQRFSAWHFPRNAHGGYAGYYPTTSTSAIAHLEALRAEGADYFALPSTAQWWLSHYTRLREHLAARYRLITPETAPYTIYALRQPARPRSDSAYSQIQQVIADFQSRWGRNPAVLDWNTQLALSDLLPNLKVFSAPSGGVPFPYLDRSVDIVFVSEVPSAVFNEACRVAASAVAHWDPRSQSLKVTWLSRRRARRLPSVSLVIPCHNQSHLTDACLDSLFSTLPPGFRGEILVVDDASSDATASSLARWKRLQPSLKVLRNRVNRGFVTSCNRAARIAQGEVLVFVNNDVVFLPAWLEPLLDVLRTHKHAGAVGSKLILPDGTIQEAGGTVFCDGQTMNLGRGEANLSAPSVNFLRSVDYCSGALLATGRALFQKLGGFDNRFRPAYYEDVDYCFRLREQGYHVYYQPASEVVHREGGTSGTDVTQGPKRFQLLNRERFVKRWQSTLARQPVRPMRVDHTALLALTLRQPRAARPSRAPQARCALVCAPQPPEPDRDSGSRRLWHLIEMLQTAQWTVTFFASDNQGEQRSRHALQQRGIGIWSSSEMRLERLLEAGPPQLAALFSWPVAEVCLPVIRRNSPETRILIDSVDLHFLRRARQLLTATGESHPQQRLDAAFGAELTRELNVYIDADAVLTVSQQEADLLQTLTPQTGMVDVLADSERIEPSAVSLSQRRGILFTGSLDHAPNVDALDWLCREVLPRLKPGLLQRHPLYVVGVSNQEDAHPLTSQLPFVRRVGWVPSLTPYLHAVRLSVVPVRYGAGTKRKLLQSLVAGTPTVSTSIGAEGFELKNGQHILQADDPATFAQAIERLLNDTKLWHRLSIQGRNHVTDRHSPGAVRSQFRKVLRRILSQPPKRYGDEDTTDTPQSTRLDLEQYHALREQILQQLRMAVPPGANVLVVSRGDDALLELDNLQASHFPQTQGGVFAGYHPADSAAAIAHLEALKAKGAEYLVFPQTAFWWLNHYRDLKDHLDQHNTAVLSHDSCVIYRLQSERNRKPRLPRATGRQQVGEDTRPLPAPAAPSVPSPAQANGTYNVVCFPIIEWDFRYQRPQQLMSQFAKAGHRVFYLSQNFRTNGKRCICKQVTPGVFEVSLRGSQLDVYQDILSGQALSQLSDSLETLRHAHAVTDAVAIVQLPFWWSLAKTFHQAAGWPVIYDCMDHHGGFHTNHPRMLAQEKELLCQADLVVTSSAPLETAARQHNSNVLLVRNGCDYEHFAKVRTRTRTRRTSPVIGYYGAIAHWFDSDLVAELAERRPDWKFLLVGSTHTADLGRLNHLPHVALPGEQPYRDIPKWLARFDVAILPFKRTPLTEATNPVKAYEILAAGKPLVSVPLPEMRLLEPLVRLAATPSEFELEIEQALQHQNEQTISDRRAFAAQHTWGSRWESLSTRLRSWPSKAKRRTGTNRKPQSPTRTPTPHTISHPTSQQAGASDEGESHERRPNQ